MIKTIFGSEDIIPNTVGEMKQPMLTKTSTTVVARLTEPAGAAQSSQLYMYGTDKPKPIPMMTELIVSITKLVEKATAKKPTATMPKPRGKILSCSRFMKKPKEAPIGIETKLRQPAKTEY